MASHALALNERPKHRVLIALAVVVGLVLLVRLVLDPLVSWGARKHLAQVPDFTATFASLHVGVLPPGLRIRNFKVIEKKAGRWDEPLFYFERGDFGLSWRKLLEGQVVSSVQLVGPKFVAVPQPATKAEKGVDLGQQLQAIAPLRLDRLEVIDGELLAAGKGRRAPQLWVHAIDLKVRNLATRKRLMNDRPADLHLRARVQRTGMLTVDARIDPWTAKPTFNADAKLEKLDVRDLYAFIADEAELKVAKGEISVYAELKVKDGVLKGGVKPVLKGIELESKDGSIGNRLKAFFADAAIELVSDDDAGDKIATVIPLRGTLDAPETQMLPTVLGVVRNAFVVGLRSGFAGLPPRTANQREGAIKQTVRALEHDEGPVSAQPSEGETKGKEAAPSAPKAEAGNP